jgi:hypothetical protein
MQGTLTSASGVNRLVACLAMSLVIGCGGGPVIVSSAGTLGGTPVQLSAGLALPTPKELILELTSAEVACIDASADWDHGPYFKRKGLQVLLLDLFELQPSVGPPTSPGRYDFRTGYSGATSKGTIAYLALIDDRCNASFPQTAAVKSGAVTLDVVNPPTGSFDFLTEQGERLSGTFGGLVNCTSMGGTQACH